MAERDRGFTLIETVVSMALFATAGMALYALFSSNLFALSRAQDVSRQIPVVRHAMERLAAVNPWSQEQGAFEFDGVEVTWTARLVEPPRRGQTKYGTLGDFDVALYDVQFDIVEGDRFLGMWRLRQVGYMRMRGLDPEDLLF